MTTDHEATRTLVKSPPELWAELSDADSLARHLDGSFGEIRITRLEPETTVAWEGERASGTVRIESSGWGTKVTLTAKTEVEAAEAAVPGASREAEAESEASREEAGAEPQAEPARSPEPQPEPTAVQPAPVRPQGVWGRLLTRFRMPEAKAEPRPSPAPEVPVAPEPEPVALEPEPVAPELPGSEPAAAAEPEPEPQAPEPDGPDASAVLSAALESLGQAHHRPFSRA